jgi:lipid II:glycine glycyltransferase (peptidoglycan interpeptide bridge formation enzyme)
MLFLNDSYTALFKSFSKGRKHAVKVGKKKGLVLRETSVKSLIEIQEKFYDYTSYSKEKLKILSHYILEHHKGEILGVFKDEVLVGGAFFLYSKKRITYLFSSFSDDGKKLQAASFLINNMIEKHQNSDLILDFEGGNMPNIGSFYKSFGADIELYNLLQKNNVIGMLKVFKK